MFIWSMQHYRTAESLLPATPVPGMHRGRPFYQPLILTSVFLTLSSPNVCSYCVHHWCDHYSNTTGVADLLRLPSSGLLLLRFNSSQLQDH